MTARRWPLHPRPREWEGLETWVRRIAAAYGVSYDTFLRHALGRTGPAARHLDSASEETLARLAEGTGVPLERLRAMRSGAILARMVERVAALMETEEGRAAYDQLCEVALSMSRGPSRAVTHAEAGMVCET